MFLPSKIVEAKLLRILAEDVGYGDITTALIISKDSVAEAEVITNEPGIVAGIEEAKILLHSLGLKVKAFVIDGEVVEVKQIMLKIRGNTQTILSVERTLLNILSRMSGIATTTKNIVEKIKKAGFDTKVACTRKTAPGLQYFDKKAVLIGNGDTHRLRLDDMILIKDNHITVCDNLENAIKKAKRNASFTKKIEVEVTDLNDVLVAAKSGVDIIMLDNFSPNQIEKAVKALKKEGFYDKILLEASGGITIQNIVSFAAKGVHVVSLGEITDSPKALDISLDITQSKNEHSESPSPSTIF